jgi:hypothetical protein
LSNCTTADFLRRVQLRGVSVVSYRNIYKKLEKLERRIHLEHISIYEEDNIKMDHKEIWYKEYLQDLINLAQNGYQ